MIQEVLSELGVVGLSKDVELLFGFFLFQLTVDFSSELRFLRQGRAVHIDRHVGALLPETLRVGV